MQFRSSSKPFFFASYIEQTTTMHVSEISTATVFISKNSFTQKESVSTITTFEVSAHNCFHIPIMYTLDRRASNRVGHIAILTKSLIAFPNLFFIHKTTHIAEEYVLLFNISTIRFHLLFKTCVATVQPVSVCIPAPNSK